MHNVSFHFLGRQGKAPAQVHHAFRGRVRRGSCLKVKQAMKVCVMNIVRCRLFQVCTASSTLQQYYIAIFSASPVKSGTVEEKATKKRTEKHISIETMSNDVSDLKKTRGISIHVC